MVIAAFRYCLGRMTYIVSDCVDWLIEIWPTLPQNVKKLIQNELEQAFKEDDKARFEVREYHPLGQTCDRASWQRLRNLWK